MISCAEADVLAAALSVGSLDNGEQAALQQHLSGCADCRRLAGEYMEAAARLPLALEPLQPSPELRGRLMRAVYAEAAQARADVAAAAPASWWRRLWAEVPAGRGFTVAAVVAAAAVIALSSWTALHRQVPSPAAAVSVALVSTPAAPNARGRLVYAPGANLAVMTVTGLPGLGAVGRGAGVYEVWLIHRDGSVVAAAYLSQGPDGTWSAALHGEMGTLSTVAATIEPQGGSLTPTGAKVVECFPGAAPQPSGGGGGTS